MQKRLTYTPQQPRAAIERYFSAITTVQETEFVNRLGEIIRREVFVTPPTLEELILRLGISMREWDSYCAGCPEHAKMGNAKRLQYRAAAEYAYDRLCVWLEQELMTRNRGSLAALGERLAQYCEKREQCHVRRQSNAGLTLEEKETLLRQLAAIFAENPDEVWQAEQTDPDFSHEAPEKAEGKRRLRSAMKNGYENAEEEQGDGET